MTHAYHEMYVGKAMNTIANMFDFAINDFGLECDDFVSMFLNSEISRSLEIGDPKYLLGMCGEELALRVIEETTGIIPVAELSEHTDRTPDHWCGWVIAYYQWLRAISFRTLFDIMSYEEISAVYPALHEADVTKFAELMDRRSENQRKETNLKRIRTAYGYSQSELARASSVSLRSIQMYEQRNKDINKGQAASMEALLES
jgi:DNA-binding transcriptional regulator YiaG